MPAGSYRYHDHIALLTPSFYVPKDIRIARNGRRVLAANGPIVSRFNVRLQVPQYLSYVPIARPVGPRQVLPVVGRPAVLNTKLPAMAHCRRKPKIEQLEGGFGFRLLN
jgi:hypothetical protein